MIIRFPYKRHLASSHLHGVSVADELSLDKTSKTGAIIQSPGNSVLGRGPAVQVEGNGQVQELF